MKYRSWLLPAALILFILEILLLPVAIGVTYGGPSDGPNHVLVYTTNKLTWDSSTGIRPDGTAELSLFSDGYDGVKSEDGMKIVAPGTNGKAVVRLKNDVPSEITYTAVLYEIKSNDALGVEAALRGENLKDTRYAYLPEEMKDAGIVRAVSGVLQGKSFKDLTVEWSWAFDDGDNNDTDIANQAEFSESDDITVGLYVVVEDSGIPQGGGYTTIVPEEPDDDDDTEYIDEDDTVIIVDLNDPTEPIIIDEDIEYADLVLPDAPKGGSLLMKAYLVLMGICGAMLLFLLLSGKKGSDKA